MSYFGENYSLIYLTSVSIICLNMLKSVTLCAVREDVIGDFIYSLVPQHIVKTGP